MLRRGLLLLNLGTTDSPDVPAVRRYLRQFLSDPRVLDISPLVRSFLLNCVILPRRPRETAAAYQIVWTERGSPLLYHGQDLVEKLRLRLGVETPVELGMRYQNPSISAALRRLQEQEVESVVVFPLFPQYSSAANGSALEELYTLASQPWNVPPLQVVPPYFDHPAFIEAWVGVVRPIFEDLRPDYVLLSYHGLPERHVCKSDESNGGHCLQSPDCCERLVAANRNCYRAHCFATSRALAERLNLTADSYEVTFQSRLGRDPWIRPYTDERVVTLAKEGVKRLAVLCPAFVADCLETIEEIGIRARDDFTSHGGEELRLVPSLNSTDAWADAILQITHETTGLHCSDCS